MMMTTTTTTTTTTMNSTNSTNSTNKTNKKHGTSSLLHVESLSKIFLWITFLVFTSLGVVLWNTETPLRTTSWERPFGTVPYSAAAPSGHQWALAQFGFPSAFHDSLYSSSSSSLSDNLLSLPCQPQRLHLSQASDVNHVNGLVNMTLSFTLPLEDCQNVHVTVLYGRGEFPEGTVSEGEVLQFTYDASLAVPDLMDYQSDWIHHMVLPNFYAGRQLYWYRILVVQQRNDNYDNNDENHDASSSRLRSKNLLGKTSLYTVMTPPLSHQPTSLALVGDLGQTENSTKTMHHIYQATMRDSVPISGLVIAGDLSYADGDPRRWTSWMELMEPLLRSTPLFSIPGNHEIECDNTTHQVFQQYESYFRNPNRIRDAEIRPIPDDYRRTLWSCLTSSEFLGHYNYGNAFWSVQHGMVQIIGLNSYTSTLPESPQYQWLNHQLQQVDRSVTPWLLVVFHCPLHTTFQGHNGEINSLLMLRTMEPLFVEYQVNIVVSGHDHAYMRTHPMNGWDIDAKGPIYLTLGAGGNREQHSKGYIHPHHQEEWVIKRDILEYGFGHLQVPNATHAHLTWVRDGTTTKGIRDSVWLQNQYYL